MATAGSPILRQYVGRRMPVIVWRLLLLLCILSVAGYYLSSFFRSSSQKIPQASGGARSVGSGAVHTGKSHEDKWISGGSSNLQDILKDPSRSKFPAIIISSLLSPKPVVWVLGEHPRVPFACLVVIVVDGDTLRCVPVESDFDVYVHLESQQEQALEPLSNALGTSTSKYVEQEKPPQLVLSPWPSRCSPLPVCTLRIRLYAIDAPETWKGKPKPAAAAGEKRAVAYGSAHLDVGGQPLGVAASAALAAMVLGRVVLLQPLRNDRYGRLLARVLVPSVTSEQTDGPQAFGDYIQQLSLLVATHNEAGNAPSGKHRGNSFKSERLSYNALPAEGHPKKWERHEVGLDGLKAQQDPLMALSAASEALQQIVGSPEVPLPALWKGSSLGGKESGQRVSLKTLEEAQPPLLHDASDAMLRRGLSSLYTGRGAAYAGRLQQLQLQQQAAISSSEGIWGLPPSLRQSPAEYKRANRRRN
ncbi:hypothetical protein, conserved [Eimeria tenella]|uniref:TNase-like domain-containing protein n=1 Tax=Eimeria tenella TaxID=5802 RepID=U6KIG7_EIMTE|nr:hypothetical protein, conserved [Eimeria tenella]CDJ37729.1 hypothetical protein, conserved [Eimeria tenella]|eukprot:XP_013228567.1 hypothetical protein, conserved [Eimeria tenella]